MVRDRTESYGSQSLRRSRTLRTTSGSSKWMLCPTSVSRKCAPRVAPLRRLACSTLQASRPTSESTRSSESSLVEIQGPPGMRPVSGQSTADRTQPDGSAFLLRGTKEEARSTPEYVVRAAANASYMVSHAQAEQEPEPTTLWDRTSGCRDVPLSRRPRAL